MPSKKRNKNAQPTPLPMQSDYDTDAANLTDIAPAIAPPPQRTNTELNLMVLQKYMPNIEQIVCIAPFAVVYTFSPDTQQWEKCGMEGTLFVCRLSDDLYPRWSVMILNRKSLENFVAELLSPDDVEITPEYVILQVANDEGVPQIYGLWIFSDGDETQNKRDVIASTIQQCATMAQEAREFQPAELQDTYVESDSFNGYESHPPAAYVPTPPQSAGQQININQLFNSQPMMNVPGPPPVQHPQVPHGHFPHPVDNAFFRGASPAVPQQSQPPPQQNALLNLFKSAR